MNETLTTAAKAGLPDRASSMPMPNSTDQTRAASATRWRATGAFHATAKSAAISQNPTNGRCTFDTSNTRMPLQMQAVTSATASALRDPVSAAAASAPAAHSSMPPAKSPPRWYIWPMSAMAAPKMIEPTPARQIGEMGTAEAVEQGADAVGAGNAGDQDGKARRPRDRRPVGRDESEERRRDQESADNADHRRDGDAFAEAGGSVARMASAEAAASKPSACQRARSASSRCR